MSLITGNELARGAALIAFGSLAGLTASVWAPGSALWLLPAAGAVAGGALTVPEVRAELQRALPLLAGARPLLAAPARALGAVEHWRRTGELPAPRPSPLLPAPAAAPPQEADEGAALFDALESTPHRLIIGHTRGGKTTLIHHMATLWAARGERVLVGDPDAAPGLWPGCEVRGAGDDVASIGELLAVVASEVKARRTLRAQGVRRFPPLHVVIDEAQDVLPVLDGGLELFEDVARRGGKLNIRMTVGVQDRQVKTLGLEGKSALLCNLQIADVMKNREGRRVAVLRDAETSAKTSFAIPALLNPETLISGPAAAVGATDPLAQSEVAARAPGATPATTSLLAELMAELPAAVRAQVPDISPERAARLAQIMERQQTVHVARDGGGGVTVNIAQIAAAPALAPPTAPRRRRGKGIDIAARRARAAKYQQIRALVAQGRSGNEIDRAVPGERKDTLALVRQAKAELGG